LEASLVDHLEIAPEVTGQGALAAADADVRRGRPLEGADRVGIELALDPGPSVRHPSSVREQTILSAARHSSA